MVNDVLDGRHGDKGGWGAVSEGQVGGRGVRDQGVHVSHDVTTLCWEKEINSLMNVTGKMILNSTHKK